jgi:riboflavin kinase / FMN adenylyltransferase
MRGMDMLSDYQTDPCLEGTVMALGNFDGIHLGHRTIIEETARQAAARGTKSSVLLLHPHPMQFFRKETGPFLLTAIGDKRALFKALGIACVFIEKFDEAFASLTPEAFVREVLIGKYRVRGVVVGFDYTFGRRGAGNTRRLQELGAGGGFSVTVREAVLLKGKVVSSTLIRGLIARGRLEEAALYLGSPYHIRGRVIAGSRLGRTLGFPTANLQVDPDIMLPGKGVYLTSAGLQGQHHFALANVGFKPTVAGQHLSVELHLLNFSGDIYGEELKVSFLHRMRSERTFGSTDELKEQILRDILKGEDLIREKYGGAAI